MANKPPIRIRNKDVMEYRRLRRNTQAKIRRTKKNYGIDLTNEVDTPKLDSFQTRDEFNAWKNRQKSFTNPSNLHYQFKKNPQGVVANKAEIQQAERRTKRAQEIADSVRKQTEGKPFISGGKQKSTYGKQQQMLGKPNYGGIVRPSDFDFENFESRRGFEKRLESMERRSNVSELESRMETMKQNYIEKLAKTFNSDSDQVRKRVQDMPAKDYYEMTLMYEEMQFDKPYIEDSSHFLNKVSGYLDRYERGDVDLDLKMF